MFAIDERRPPGPEAAAAPGDALAAAVDRLLAVEPDTLTDAELTQAMVDLRRQQSRVEAAVTELTAAFDARRAWADDGSRNAADWLAVRAGRPRPEVAAEVRLGRCLRSMPRVRRAWRNGDISPAHARALARLATHPRAGAHFPGGEQMLVERATTERYDDFQRITRYWLQAADPDGPEHQRRRDHDLRRFGLPIGLDGVGHPDGYLTPLAAATVGEALERLEHEMFTADRAEARARRGDAATIADLARTAAQRRHDALVEMAVRSMTAPDGGQRPAPLVTVVVGYETFAGPVSELARGTVVGPGTVAELLGHDDTLVQRVVFDGANRITDISSARRFRGTLRRLLDVKQRRCDHETCFVPAHRCEGDHIVPWSSGGQTSQANGRLECGPHNRWSFTQRHTAAPPTSPRRATGRPPPRRPARPPSLAASARSGVPADAAPADATPADAAPAGGHATPRSRPICACRRARRHRLVLRGGDGTPVQVDLTPGGSASAEAPTLRPPAG